MEKIRVGVIGFGQRGEVITHLLLDMENIQITAVCDKYEDRAEKAAKTVEEKGFEKPFATTDYKKVVDKNLVDCVIILSPWDTHVEMSVYCMEQGMPCGSEVGGAETLEECITLVRAWEKARTPFMFLENCCYGRRELMVLNMVKKGLFGDVVHCAGGYMHDLRDEVAFGKENRHYRLHEYMTRNCENYPTHELGPIARILNIGHGNRMVSLTSTASKAAGLHSYVLEDKPEDADLAKASFAQGDIITTVIKCAGGETITLTLDTTLPRYYSRGFTVHGTKAFYEEATDSLFFDGMGDHFEWDKHWGNAKVFADEHESKLWRKFLNDGVKGGHGGMDFLVYDDFFRCLRENKPMPIDVYDAAAWMCIAPLSAKSIAQGSAPMEIPDFQNLK